MHTQLFNGALFIELQRVESTNNYATGLVHAGLAQPGTAVFAHHQTAGKGQRQKVWLGEAGKNIAMSLVLLPPAMALTQSFGLSMTAAVALRRFFSGYAGEDAKIKWPNDLYWRDRKAAGILIENIVQGREWKAAVIGIGVNVNQTAFEGLEGRAVSLKQITGKDHKPLDLAKELYRGFFMALAEWKEQPSKIAAEYQSFLYKRNETVRLKQGNRVFGATVKCVSNTGELVVQHAVEESFAVGEVEWVL